MITSTAAKRKLVGAVLAAVLGTGAASCYDSIPTAPSGRFAPGLPTVRRFDLQPLAPTSISLAPTPDTKTLITIYPFPEGIIVEASINGTETVVSDSRARYQFGSALDYRGYSQSDTWGTQCDVNATFFTWATLNLTGCGGSGASYHDTVFVKDSVFGVRGPGILYGSGDCGTSPCYTYPSSNQVLTVAPLAAALEYTASTYFLTEAQMTAYYAPYTYFRSAANPAYFKGIPTPKRFLQRAWHKADPAVPPYNTDINGYCGEGIPVCDLPVRESGIFWAKERVNGVEREDSVAINCYAADSLLNFLAGRKRFMDAVDSSKAADSVMTNRREFVFAIMRDPYTHALSVMWIDSPNKNTCSSPFGAMAIDPQYGFGTVLAIVHVHPDRPGEVITCPNIGNVKTAPGLSDTDYVNMKALNKIITDSLHLAPVPWYAIDRENIYRLKPGDSLIQSTAPENTFSWDRGRCKWARPTPTQVPIDF